MKEEILQLERAITDLEIQKGKIDATQLSFPIDLSSKETLYENIPTQNGDILIPANLGTYEDCVEITLNGKKYLLETTDAYQ